METAEIQELKHQPVTADDDNEPDLFLYKKEKHIVIMEALMIPRHMFYVMNKHGYSLYKDRLNEY